MLYRILKKVNIIIQKLSSYPKIGKFFGSLFGFFEVPILELIHFIDTKIKPGSYQKLMKSFSIFYGSKIIPLNIKIESSSTLAPTDEIISLIRKVPAVSLGYCYCRTKSNNCSNPKWTCIHIGTAQHLEELGKKIPLKSKTHDEIIKILKKANKLGLVHQLLTSPNPDYVYVICNCCPCCCVMLRNAVDYNISGNAIPSNFVIHYEEQKCQGCGICSERCYFNCLQFQNNMLELLQENCLGCGLCLTSCPNDALSLTKRN